MQPLPELDYYVIRAVVRGARVVPAVAGLLAFVLLLVPAWRSGDPTWTVAAVMASLLCWFPARLLVEVVAVVADTLLPR